MTSTPPSPAPPPPLPPDVPGLLRTLLAEPGRPRVTWYGPDGERVELSSKVLDNWVAKSANLLVDELDAGPGSAVLVDLPAHWRTMTWFLAIWATGAAAVLPGPSSGGPPAVPTLPAALHPDAVVTPRPQHWDGAAAGPFAAATLLAVTLPALATRFPGPLPDGAVDAATEIRGHGDVFLPVVRPAPGDPALVTADGVVTHGALLPAAARAASASGLPGGVRLLAGSGPGRVLDSWLAALVSGGSLVLHHDLPGLDDAARERLIAQEGVTAVG